MSVSSRNSDKINEALMDREHNLPQHVAIVMDGNGRWAKKRLMPRIAGHRIGAKAVRKAIQYCVTHHIPVLSLFALSVENFVSRPSKEVQFLLSLFSDLLHKEVNELHATNIRVTVIGDHSLFEKKLRDQIDYAEQLTQHNTGLTLVIAANYSGRWDILQATQKMTKTAMEKNQDPDLLVEADFAKHLCLSHLPEPDLLIRTSGEQRISNFMLWQVAYTELCFIDDFWPDFDESVFEKAIALYRQRERRFGCVG